MPDVLVVDDDADISLLLSNFLTKKGYSVKTAGRGSIAIELLKDHPFDVVLCDHRLPDTDSLRMLEQIRTLRPNAATIVITGYSDVRLAVELIRRGAFDYVVKPLYPDEILMRVQDAVAARTTQAPQNAPVGKQKAIPPAPVGYVAGTGPQARIIAQHIALVAPTELTVLITGETGTGKEYLAKEIHRQSSRAHGPFIALDCGALQKELAASELFGHVKGSFTGAVGDKTGSFVLAKGGTLFLDEIGNLSYENQIRLLRALQERMVKPVGAEKEIAVDVRVLAATNDNLRKAVADGRFREDLFHRVDEFNIDLAPLRERKTDMLLFAEHFRNLASQQLGKQVNSFAPEVIEVFMGHRWPGNLRELGNVVKRAVLMAKGEEVLTENLPMDMLHSAGQHDHNNGEEPSGHGLKDAAHLAEKQTILASLERNNFNRTRASEELGIDRKTLYNKMRSLGIDN